MTDTMSATPVRLAAALILARATGGEPAFLMGRRTRDAVFMPSKLVFPGGRLEEADIAAAAQGPAPETPCARAATAGHRPVTAEVFAGLRWAALRELEEETGVRPPDPAGRPLRLVCRAITPPGQVRRYDTWFFVQNLAPDANSDPMPAAAGDGELEDVRWRTPTQARRDALHPITAFVLEQALMRLDPATAPAPVFVSLEQGRADVRPL